MPDKFDPVHNLLAREGNREGAPHVLICDSP